MSANKKGFFPLEIRRLSEEEAADALDIKKGIFEYYIRVGPDGYFYTNKTENLFPEYYNLELRQGDIFVVGFPKTGTNWTEELVWLVANNFDYKTATSVKLGERFVYIGCSLVEMDITNDILKQACKQDKSLEEAIEKSVVIQGNGVEILGNKPSPRFAKTHLPFSMLPPDIFEKSKVVYVARDPRDVAVSFFHMIKIMPALGYKGEFKDFWRSFKKDSVFFAPYLAHLKEAWALKDHPNMLILFYEELSKDMPNVIRRLTAFLGKTVTDEQIAGLCEHLKFQNFRNNKMVNFDMEKRLGILKKDGQFIRKGNVGDWRNYFDEEMARDAERWMEEGLRETGFTFYS